MSAHRLWMKSGASGRAIHLDHAAVDDKHDTDGKGVHGKPHEKGLEPQPEQFSRAQGFKLRLHIRDDAADINGGISDDDACAAVHNALPHIKDTHDNIPCVRHDQYRAGRLEHPLVNVRNIKIMEIVPLNYHMDELKCHDERKNKPRNRNYDRLRKTPNHPVNTAIPSRRRLSDLCRYVTDLFVD